QVARGQELVEIVEQRGGRALAVTGDDSGQGRQLRITPGFQHAGRDHLTLATHHAVDGSVRVLQELLRDERAAVPAHDDEAVGSSPPGLLGQVNDLGDVGQVVEREPYR